MLHELVRDGGVAFVRHGAVDGAHGHGHQGHQGDKGDQPERLRHLPVYLQGQRVVGLRRGARLLDALGEGLLFEHKHLDDSRRLDFFANLVG